MTSPGTRCRSGALEDHGTSDSALLPPSTWEGTGDGWTDLDGADGTYDSDRHKRNITTSLSRVVQHPIAGIVSGIAIGSGTILEHSFSLNNWLNLNSISSYDIPIDSSLNAPSKAFWVQIHQTERLAAKKNVIQDGAGSGDEVAQSGRASGP